MMNVLDGTLKFMCMLTGYQILWIPDITTDLATLATHSIQGPGWPTEWWLLLFEFG
jgi:hypothetical protein